MSLWICLPQLAAFTLCIITAFKPSHSQTNEKHGPICISGETTHRYADLNGVYYYAGYNASIKGSRYYNWMTGYYLFPLINTRGIYLWMVGTDYTINLGFASAYILPTPSLDYIFDINDVFREWRVAIQSKWVSHPDMSAVDCTTICVSNSHHSVLNGQYIWQSFDPSQNSSIYHCDSCNDGVYLYGSSSADSNYWIFGSNLTATQPTDLSYCNVTHRLGHNSLFELDVCDHDGMWQTLRTNHTITDPLIIDFCPTAVPTMAPTVNDRFEVCVERGSLSHINLNGRYSFVSYNHIQHGAVYHNPINGLSIYPYQFSFRGMVIGNTSHTFAAAAIIKPASPGYIFDLDDTFVWRVWNGSAYVFDNDMITVECTTICVYGHSNAALDGRYMYTAFNTITTMSSVYFCAVCNDNNGIWLYGYRLNQSIYWVLAHKLNDGDSVVSRCLYATNATEVSFWRRYNYTLPCTNPWYSAADNGTNYVIDHGLSTTNCYPTNAPTSTPTTDPTANPTLAPTRPTLAPTGDPTPGPTIEPTVDPTLEPTHTPTQHSVIDDTDDTSIGPSESDDKWSMTWVMQFIQNNFIICVGIVVGLCIVCVCCIVVICCLIMNRKEKSELKRVVSLSVAQENNQNIGSVELIVASVAVGSSNSTSEGSFMGNAQNSAQFVVSDSDNGKILYNMNSENDEEVRGSDDDGNTPFGNSTKTN
eukprot:49710_1